MRSPLFDPGNQWANRFGSFVTTAGTTHATSAAAVDNQFHAEAQRTGIIAADFEYEGRLTMAEGVEPHLQCRIGDEGRFGVRLQADALTFYRFSAAPRPCAIDISNPPAGGIFAHCPNWMAGEDAEDPLEFQPLASRVCSLPAGSAHNVRIAAKGARFQVFLDDILVVDVRAAGPRVGRFGIYVFGELQHIPKATYRNLQAFVDPSERSNFALLYSTPGYDRAGPKRALVRTLNELPEALFDAKHSGYRLINRTGAAVRQGPLRALPWGDGAPGPAKTFGMQLWEADFSAHADEGVYTLEVDLATTAGVRRLASEPFAIQTRLITTKMLTALAMRNAEARRAADEDMRRNWIRVSGAWSVGLDGAFVADRANDDAGALLLRVFDTMNRPCNQREFRLFARIAIVSGCDAQVQFRIGPEGRLALTLQAGAPGGCPHAGGPGAIRLHRERPDGEITDQHHAPFPPDTPFRRGEPYDVDIRAVGNRVTVTVTGPDVALTMAHDVNPLSGNGGTNGFALKAWAATVRFENVQAWHPDVVFQAAANGTHRPLFKNWVNGGVEYVAAQSLTHWPRRPVSREDYEFACNPFFTQLHGFHDANHNVAEATSHGTFLAGLMHVWLHRATSLNAIDRESLRHAIIALVLYIERLYHQGGGTGEFAHSEMGRAGVDGNLGIYQTVYALYGLTAFADRGRVVDPPLASLAFERCQEAARFLNGIDPFGDPIPRSAIYTRLARCAEWHGRPVSMVAGFWDRAEQAADAVVVHFSTAGNLARRIRDTGDGIPWFEGVFELVESRPEWLDGVPNGLRATRRDLLAQVADMLVQHIARPHVDENGHHPANGFLVVPQGSGDEHISHWNWRQMEAVPAADRPTTLPYLHNYIVTHFARAATDAVHLGRLVNRKDFVSAAWSALAWVLGVNPGVPASKVVGGSSQTPWRAAAFVYNGDGAFARTMQGFRVRHYSAKGWMAPWEESADSPRREAWSVDPLPNGFQTIVNGHMIWDRQWDYWNSGGHFEQRDEGRRFIADGWSSGETFILHDGAFLKSAIVLEDWLVPSNGPRENPYDTSRLAFFNTTHVERSGTGWRFDDPDRTNFADAWRAATDFAVGKGFGGGRFTGHYEDERVGLICLPMGTTFLNATDQEIADAAGFHLPDLNTIHWALAARVATTLAAQHGFPAGFFTGHQLHGRRGIFCLDGSMARTVHVPKQYAAQVLHGFTDIDAVPWAQAARVATNFCLENGLLGGYFSGEDVNDHYTLVIYTR